MMAPVPLGVICFRFVPLLPDFPPAAASPDPTSPIPPASSTSPPINSSPSPPAFPTSPPSPPASSTSPPINSSPPPPASPTSPPSPIGSFLPFSSPHSPPPPSASPSPTHVHPTPPPAGSDQWLDDLNERLLETLNATGKIYLTHTRLDGRYCIRIVIGQTSQEQRHVDGAWELIRRTARGMIGDRIDPAPPLEGGGGTGGT